MQWGIAISSLETLERFSGAKQRDLFPCLHLSGALLQNGRLPELLKKSAPRRLEFFDLPPRSICQLLPGAGKVIREEFIRTFHSACRSAAQCGAAAIELGFPPDASAPDRELLHSLYGVLYDCRIRPRFSWRLPAAGGPAEPLPVLDFFRALMFDAALAVEYHPHEPAAAKLDLAELLQQVFISADAAVHLVYEPHLGNRPGRKILQKLSGILGPKQTLVLHPNSPQDAAENEWEILAGLMTEKKEEEIC